MKAAYFMQPGRFELREAPLPAPGDDEALIRNAVCGVCGTDIHIFHGEPGSATVTPPVVLGHEYAGVVEAVGRDVRHLKPGDRVTVDPNIYCGVCPYCRDGRKQLCQSMKAVGVTRDGGFAEYSVVPATQALALDAGVTLEAGAMTEPLACCLHGIDRAGIKPGDTVLVVGGGAIGLIMVQLARLAGAACVVLSEPVAMRREVALTLGADGALDPTRDDLSARLRALTGGREPNVVIECAGRVSAAQQAVRLAAKGATILLFSVPAPDAMLPLPLFDLFQKELTVMGSFVNPDTHARAAQLLASGRVRVEPLITHRFPLERLADAIAMQMSPESIKVVVTL